MRKSTVHVILFWLAQNCSIFGQEWNGRMEEEPFVISLYLGDHVFWEQKEWMSVELFSNKMFLLY